ncbi:MAG TPA: nuclear transport factor 2 family protein [Acidimicrobiia bacterium]
MSTGARGADTLARALRAGLDGDHGALADLCTDDVRVWTPGFAASSLDELRRELDRRDDAFSDVELDVTPLDVRGDYACAEWSASMTHSGPLVLRDDAVVDPTGLRITLRGVTVAELDGDRICSLRQYWDELSALEQLGLLHGEPAPG